MPTDWTQEQISELLASLSRIASREMAIRLPGNQGTLGLFGGDFTRGSNDTNGTLNRLASVSIAASALVNTTLVRVTDVDPSVVVTLATERAKFEGLLTIIKDETSDAGAHPIQIVGQGGETIDGELDAWISTDRGYLVLYADGENWRVIWTDTMGDEAIGPDAIGPFHLQETGVTAGTYGSASAIPVLTIDEDGRVEVATTAPVSSWTTGDVKWKIATGPDAGWVILSGKSIGNAASSATERANADTQALFVHCWGLMNDSICPVSGGRGVSALADFNANKRLTLPDATGRVVAGLENPGTKLTTAGSGVDGGTLGASGGHQQHTLTEPEMPSHSHSGKSQEYAPGVQGTDTGRLSFAYGSTGTAGGDQPHRNVQPTLILCCMVKL